LRILDLDLNNFGIFPNYKYMKIDSVVVALPKFMKITWFNKAIEASDER
jgi:hypothetical protein